MVDAEAGRLNLKGLSPELIPPIKRVLLQATYKLFPSLFVLIFILMVLKFTPQKAAFWGTMVLLTTYLIEKIFWRRERIVQILKELVEMSRLTCLQVLPVLSACAAAGIVIGIITVTGVGLKLSSNLVVLAGGNLLLICIFAMVASIILGMGVPITATYIIVAIIAATALVRVGVEPLAAHFFVLYFGVLSGITPPVALASYVGAGIAGGDNMKTGFESMKIGLVAFILPYFWICDGAFLGRGTPMEIAGILATALIGVYCFACALQGYILDRKATAFLRGILFVLAFALISPHRILSAAGIVIFILTISILIVKPQAFRKRRS